MNSKFASVLISELPFTTQMISRTLEDYIEFQLCLGDTSDGYAARAAYSAVSE